MSYRKDGFLVPAGRRTTAGWFTVTVLLALLAWTTGALAQLTWDPAAEFSPVNNPNGPWTYGQANALGASISPFGNLDHCGGVVDIRNMAPGAHPSVLHNGTGLTVHCSAGLDIPPGALALHPSNSGQYAVIRWTAPLDLPSLTIDATFLGLDANGTTTDMAILLNSSPLWSSWIGYNGHAYSASTSLPLTNIHEGDTIDFAVGYGNGNYYDDTTRLIATLHGAPTSPGQRILVYSTRSYGTALRATDFDSDLPVVLVQDHHAVTVADRASMAAITPASLAEYDQLWFISTESGAILSSDELQAIEAFHAAGKGIMIIGDGCAYTGPANQFAPGLGVQFTSARCCDCAHCGGAVGCLISTAGFTAHDIWAGVSQIQANQNEGDLSVVSTGQILASNSGINMVAVNTGTGGRVAWDATVYRFSDSSAHSALAITYGDNARYVQNVAGWLANAVVPPCLTIVQPLSGWDADASGAVTFQWTAPAGLGSPFLEFARSPDLSTSSLAPAGSFASPFGGRIIDGDTWTSPIAYFTPGEYYWHVLLFSDDELTCSSPTMTFRVPSSGVATLRLEDPVVALDRLVFQGEALDNNGALVANAKVYCLDGATRSCQVQSTSPQGSFRFECGPLSTAPKGVLSFEFLSGNARTFFAADNLLPRVDQLHPTPSELNQLLAANSELAGIITDISLDVNHSYPLWTPPKPLMMPIMNSTLSSWNITAQMDDLTRLNASASLGADLFYDPEVGPAGSRTATNCELFAKSIGSCRAFRGYLYTRSDPGAYIVDIGACAFGIAGAAATVEPLPLALCIPLVSHVGIDVSWGMINEQVAKGRVDAATVDRLRTFQQTVDVVKFFVASYDLYRSAHQLWRAPQGKGGLPKDVGLLERTALMQQANAGWQTARYTEATSAFAVSPLPATETARNLQIAGGMIGDLEDLVNGGETIYGMTVPPQPDNGAAVIEAQGVFSNGREFSETIIVGRPTKLVVDGGCPFTLRIIDADGRTSGWSHDAAGHVEDIPMSAYSGPEALRQEVRILQPEGSYHVVMDGTGTGEAKLLMRLYRGDAVVWADSIAGTMEQDRSVDHYIDIRYRDGNAEVRANSPERGWVYGHVLDNSGNGIGGVAIDLFGENGTLVQSVSTDPDGHYNFGLVANGRYRVQVLAPSGYEVAVDTKEVQVLHAPVEVDFALVRSGAERRCVWYDSGQITMPATSRGIAWGDYDNDGDQDLVVANIGARNQLYRNDAGVLVLIPDWCEDVASSMSAAWGDYDNDGDLDLYVVNDGSANALYRNDGGTFTRVDAGDAADDGRGYNAAWVDYDRDGWLDLYLCNVSAMNHLYHNNHGRLEDAGGVTEVTGSSRGCAFGDYDNDGDQDLYVSRVGENRLFRNDEGLFVDVTAPPVNNAGEGKGVAWGDYDNDGDLDLYLVNSGGGNRLFRNDHDSGGFFTDVTEPLTADGGYGRACAWADYNNDGWLDLFLATASGGNHLFHNLGTGFVDSTCGALAATASLPSWGCGFADYDSDGDQDLAIAVGSYNALSKLIRNDLIGGAEKNWLQFDLRGVASNKFGVGARIEIESGGLRQMREVSASGAYLSQAPLTASFGLGDATQADVTVRWPSGLVQEVSGVAVNQRLTLVEPSSATGTPDAVVPSLLRVTNRPNPFNPRSTIGYSLPQATRVTISVYDLQGRLVRGLVDETKPAGEWSAEWDGRDNAGQVVASGTYLVRLVTDQGMRTSKVMLAK